MPIEVETPNGKLAGSEEEGVRAFRGVPFARPPVGALRFAAPEPAEPWTGVREAIAFGASSHQTAMLLPLPGMDVGAQAEDCLFANVWTPEGASGLPVMVWIHGGGFVIGSGSQQIYDGAALARRGEVVVVSINYRLGSFGFLHLTDLCPGMEGLADNVGMRDQVAGLEWVRDHIEAFGGDPGNVTIFGESAGGMSVGTLLGMPSARGLFHKAIPQSGACHNFHTREAASKVAETFLEALGISPAEAATRLRDVPAKKLVEAQGATQLGLSTTLGLLPFQPVICEDSLPAPALGVVRAGAHAGMPILIGSTRDEWKLFSMMDPTVVTLDEAGMLAKLGEALPEIGAREVMEVYGGGGRGLADVFFAAQTDRVFRIPAIRLAEAQQPHAPVYMYRVDWESPVLGGMLGACHAIELPFVFGTHAKPGADQFIGSGPEVDALAETMMDAWAAFARTGDPGWQPFDPDTRATMLFGRECGVAKDPAREERLAWEGLL
jgi:para-nitrobenzyl esterase